MPYNVASHLPKLTILASLRQTLLTKRPYEIMVTTVLL